MPAERIEFHHYTNRRLNFPESIDVDRAGNLYLSDALEGALYRFRRREDGTLDPGEERLLEGFKSAHGISVSQDDVLCLSALVKEGNRTEPRVIAFSLKVLNECTDLPYSYSALKACAEAQGTYWRELALPGKDPPNGVIWSERERALYFTVTRLRPGLFGRKGHVARATFDAGEPALELLKERTPNGIDLDPLAETPTLLVALSLKQEVGRITLPAGAAPSLDTFGLGTRGPWPFGHGPDGLLCLENGDLLVASFVTGHIFCFPRQGDGYGDAFPVAEGLGVATDLVLGTSSSGVGKSLYVTAMKPLLKGKVIEIPNILEVIA